MWVVVYLNKVSLKRPQNTLNYFNICIYIAIKHKTLETYFENFQRKHKIFSFWTEVSKISPETLKALIIIKYLYYLK